MKNSLFGNDKQSTVNRQLNIFLPIKVITLLLVVSLIYACSTINSEDYSTMSNNNKLLQKGDEAPEFTANTYNDTSINFAQLRKSGPVVLIFIRGFS